MVLNLATLYHVVVQVLHSFMKMGVADGLGSRKVEVLADTAVTLEQGEEGIVASEIIKKLLSVSLLVTVVEVCRL